MRVDEGRKGWTGLKSPRDKNEGVYRSGEGGEKSLLNDPGSEQSLGREKEKTQLRRH